MSSEKLNSATSAERIIYAIAVVFGLSFGVFLSIML